MLLYAVLGLVALQRLAELAWSRRNERALRAEGAVEHGRGHYPLFVILHGCWLAAMALFISPEAPAAWNWLGLFVVMQAARVWTVASLGRYWTTRVITLPGEPLVHRGPYRFLRHPNYLIVSVEIATLPIAFGAWQIAAIFTVLNLALLWHRIQVEEAALAERRALG
ncbi:MAG: isoprenylcysteine carboxylmethyltransferase family protein [Alphaproteobacteria bacterium]